MTTVADLLHFMEHLAPGYMKYSWDHVGLNCGRLDHPVRRILVALDPFKEACLEAKELGADLLITHHALLWNEQFITDENEAGRNALFLIENGIASINAHTNLDCTPGGVNDALAACLGLRDVTVPCPNGTMPDGTPYGLIHVGTAEEQPLEEFLGKVRNSLDCPGLRYTDGGRKVHLVAVGGGSCASELPTVIKAGCDTFVTADVKYNQFWDAQDNGINLIDAGHFYTENPVCQVLAGEIRAAFPGIAVTVSKKHHDCMKFFR